MMNNKLLLTTLIASTVLLSATVALFKTSQSLLEERETVVSDLQVELIVPFNNSDFNGPIHVIKRYKNNSILIAGSFTTFKGHKTGHIVKINMDGEIDESFQRNIGNGFDNQITDLAIQKDGLIHITGDFEKFNNMSARKYLTINANGLPTRG